MSAAFFGYYNNISNYVNISDAPEFELGILRNGCYMLQQKKYKEACEIFESCSPDTTRSIISDFGIAKASYAVN